MSRDTGPYHPDALHGAPVHRGETIEVVDRLVAELDPSDIDAADAAGATALSDARAVLVELQPGGPALTCQSCRPCRREG